jgi:hypothetical protein
MSNTFTAGDNSSTHSGSSTLRYQHRIVWDEDKKQWNCVKCHRSSGYASKHEALMELAQHDCILSRA